MKIKPSKKLIAGIIIIAGLSCWGITQFYNGNSSIKSDQGSAVEVKAMHIVKRDTPISYEFVGKVISKNEVEILSKVSGNVVAKMVEGGDVVYTGQPLFRIDNKQYNAAIKSAKAALTKSQASLRNTQRDLERYRTLAASGAVAQQTLDSYEVQAEEEAATVEENRAALEQAIMDEQDTLILSPVDGKLDINDIAIGQFVAAGSTAMGSVSSLDPIWVQFSMSENEYIKLTRQEGRGLPAFKDNIRLTLSDGSEYERRGSIEQLDKGIDDTTGTMSIKAAFANTEWFLVPGMFAKVSVPGGLKEGALLIPQRAVKELLDETFVTVVTSDNKAKTCKVTMGERVGNLWVVSEGLNEDETVVVEGVDKVKKGTDLKVTMITTEDLEVSAKKEGN